jgi:phosphohistidine swiveling domain-containing protein
MPDPVSPLFATLAIPALSGVGIKEVLGPLTRSEPDLPNDYITTINEYAYMGVVFTPHQWWWILTKLLLSFPRILREALPFWRDKIRPRYEETAARWQDQSLETMSAAELWAGIQEVNNAAMMHLATLMVATTGASAGAEGLFTRVYEIDSPVATDIGGPLSHGSIVAREYGIPAVLGTGVATRRIRNGQTITVDGSAGTVTIL